MQDRIGNGEVGSSILLSSTIFQALNNNFLIAKYPDAAIMLHHGLSSIKNIKQKN